MVWYVYQLVDGSSQGRVSLQASQLDCECPEGQSGCLPNVPLSFPKDMGTPTRTRYMPLVMVRRNLYTYVGAKTFVIPLPNAVFTAHTHNFIEAAAMFSSDFGTVVVGNEPLYLTS